MCSAISIPGREPLCFLNKNVCVIKIFFTKNVLSASLNFIYTHACMHACTHACMHTHTHTILRYAILKSVSLQVVVHQIACCQVEGQGAPYL